MLGSLIIFRYSSNQARSKIVCDPIQRGVLLFEEAGDVCGDFVLVSKHKVVAVI